MLTHISYKSTFCPRLTRGGASNGFIISNLIFEDINNSACAFIWGYGRKSYEISIPEAIEIKNREQIN